MSDRELRALEREGVRGDPAARRRLLRAQVRSGAIPADRVSLRARLGDDVAASLEPDGTNGTNENPTAWVDTLSPWGDELLIGVAIAAASLAVPVWREEPGQVVWAREEDPWGLPRWKVCDVTPTRALTAAKAWLRCPCGACAAEAERASSYTRAARGDWQAVFEYRDDDYAGSGNQLAEHAAAMAPGLAARATATLSGDSTVELVQASLEFATTAAAWAWTMTAADAWPSVRASAGAIVLGWLSSLPT